jgi:ornithine carbamoyltransferase
LLDLDLAIACPPGYDPDPGVLAQARASGRGRIHLTRDPREAVAGRQVVSTDVFASMGQEAQAETRRRAFAGFCVDSALMSVAHKDAIVLHCLPAHRGEEITDEVMEGPQSQVWLQAENRLHAQKALLEWILH